MLAGTIGIASFLLFSYGRTRWPLLFAPRTKLKGESGRFMLLLSGANIIIQRLLASRSSRSASIFWVDNTYDSNLGVYYIADCWIGRSSGK
jgi:hypothetical protein